MDPLPFEMEDKIDNTVRCKCVTCGSPVLQSVCLLGLVLISPVRSDHGKLISVSSCFYGFHSTASVEESE